ncbi:MAG: hypothetical protein JXB48_13540 [Candidatus Latescibacteria bacterium]|nr:hypothetical protein [Candidatus Latescibacterota bacterium]
MQLTGNEYANAVAIFRKTVTLDSNHVPSIHNLGKALYFLGDVSESVRQFRRAFALGDSDLPLSAEATIIPSDPLADNKSISEIRRSWGKILSDKNNNQKTKGNFELTQKDHLCIGYVSSFFHKKNWMKPVWGLINNHNRDKFKIFLFSDAPESKIKGYDKHPLDRFYDITSLSNSEVAELIVQKDIDILIDLNGYSCIERLPLLVNKPAPVIIGWFNMYATSGLACYDYIIGDKHVIPIEEEKWYGEKIIRIPGSYLTFNVTYPVPEISPPPCLTHGYITFGSLSSLYKITGEVIKTWSSILLRSPTSRLLIKNAQLESPGNRSYILDKFAFFGVSEDRIELEGPSEHYDFLRKYDEIDIALDTFPYNGGTTTTEALWQGVPVITFYGDRWVSRTGSSILKTARLEEFVCYDIKDYIEKAVQLAESKKTPNVLCNLRFSMRTFLKNSPICDTTTFTEDMERIYRNIWDYKIESNTG